MAPPKLDLAAIVRQHNPDRYSATLFAPETKRDDLFTLYGFDAQISRIPALVSDPLPGEIRLQWWREVVSGERAGEANGSPDAQAMLSLIEKYSLPAAVFDTYFDARIFDFYNDAYPDTIALEAWCGETSSSILQMACLILNPQDAKLAADASGHGGVALGIASILQQLPRTRASGQCYIPTDILNACGLDAAAFVQGEDVTKIKSATDALCALGTVHLKKHQAAARQLPKSLKSVFLPVANTALIFNATTKPSAQPAFSPIAPSALRSLFGIFKAALR